MPNGQKPVARRNYFIKKDFQARFIFKFLMIILLGIITSTGILFVLSQDTLTSSFHDSRLVIKNTSEAIFPAVIYTNLITLGLITVAAIIVVLFISHKIAGPIFRFEKELRNIGEGDLTIHTSLREDDQFKEVADSINAMTEKLHMKVSDIKKVLFEIEDVAVKPDHSIQLVQKIKRLQENIDQNFKL